MQYSQPGQIPAAVQVRSPSKEVGHRLSELINSPVLKSKKINDLSLATKTPIKYLTKSNKHSALSELFRFRLARAKEPKRHLGAEIFIGVPRDSYALWAGGSPRVGSRYPRGKDCLSMLSGRATFPSPTHNITQRSSYKARLELSSAQVAGKVLGTREF
jgi:hypothetical protein